MGINVLVCSITQSNASRQRPIIHGCHESGPLAGHYKGGSQWFFFPKEVALVLEKRKYCPFYELRSLNPDPGYEPLYSHDKLVEYYKVLYRGGFWFVETADAVEFTGKFPEPYAPDAIRPSLESLWNDP